MIYGSVCIAHTCGMRLELTSQELMSFMYDKKKGILKLDDMNDPSSYVFTCDI